ncbi:MAG TPA: ABC transporter substrate-binding protein [Chloroflexota bacterium]|nr:ABC transporter substrate-binding protein [Chloroflexota bacterium]
MRTGRWARRVGVGLLLLGALGLGGTPAGGSSAAPHAEAASAEIAVADAWAGRASATGGEATASAALPQLQPARVGIVGTSSEVGIHLANERGYFAEQGLTPDYSRFDSATFAVAPLSSGELDVASGAVSAALFNAINRGVELRLAAPLSRYERGYSQSLLDVRKDLIDSGAIRDYGDLRGRTLAILAAGSTTEMLAERMLQRAGLGLGDVNVVQLGSGDQIAAFANGAIDAGIITEPQATIAEDRGVAVKWREVADWSPGVQVSNILYGPSYVSRNPDAGQRFMVAYLRGVRDYYDAIIAGRGDREAVIDVLMRDTALKDRALYDRMLWVYMDPNLVLDEADLRATMQWFVDRGLTDHATDLNVAVDKRFADYAVRTLGPYR